MLRTFFSHKSRLFIWTIVCSRLYWWLNFRHLRLLLLWLFFNIFSLRFIEINHRVFLCVFMFLLNYFSQSFVWSFIELWIRHFTFVIWSLRMIIVSLWRRCLFWFNDFRWIQSWQKSWLLFLNSNRVVPSMKCLRFYILLKSKNLINESVCFINNSSFSFFWLL